MGTQKNVRYVENVTFPEFLFPFQYSEIMDPNTIQQILQLQFRLMEHFSERFGISPQPNPSSTKLISGQALENSIKEFHYDKEANTTFAKWFARYEDLFKEDFGEQTDSWKVRLLLRKIGPSEHEKYTNILPKQPCIVVLWKQLKL